MYILLSIIMMAGTDAVNNSTYDSLFNKQRSDLWRIVNDGVMGGISTSTMQIEDNSAFFSGQLSLENNGGFASVAYRGLDGVSVAATGIYVDVSGDARDFQLRLRMSGFVDGISYRVFFQPQTESKRLYFEFSEFEAVFRGRRVLNAPALEPQQIRQLGFLIGDKNTTPFSLQVHDFGVYYAGAD